MKSERQPLDAVVAVAEAVAFVVVIIPSAILCLVAVAVIYVPARRRR